MTAILPGEIKWDEQAPWAINSRCRKHPTCTREIRRDGTVEGDPEEAEGMPDFLYSFAVVVRDCGCWEVVPMFTATSTRTFPTGCDEVDDWIRRMAASTNEWPPIATPEPGPPVQGGPVAFGLKSLSDLFNPTD